MQQPLEPVPASSTWCDRNALRVVVALFIGLCAITVSLSIHLNDGKFVYPLDDTYIGMAMAKNFSQHGVWGVTRHEFTSSSSTPLFSLILSGCYWLTGPNEWWPLVLAITFGVLSLWAADRIIRKFLSGSSRLVALTAFSVLPPMHIQGTIGMEHSLHIFLTLLFVGCIAQALQEPQHIDLWLFIVTPLMVATRYEGLFLVAMASLLLVRTRWKMAVSVSIVALLPVLVYGAVSLRLGCYWLPNAISMKGAMLNQLSIWPVVYNLCYVVRRAPYMPVMCVALLIAGAHLHGKSRYLSALSSLTSGGIVLHLLLADVGWVFRYEAYLIALGVVVLTCSGPLVRSRSAVLVGAFCFCLLLVRAGTASYDTLLRSAAIYQQQFQMAQFVHSYFDGTSLAANDIGALNYYSDLSCLDLTGLASNRIFWAKRAADYKTGVIESESLRQRVKLAMLYDDWFSPQPRVIFGGPPVPANWIRVARWRIESHGRVGSDTVSFYGTDEAAAEQLRAAMNEYRPRLPAAVQVLP